jgi:undecaprenyl-diphosphatase
MIDIFHSAIMGAIQGTAEFLPISSSGHLVLIPYLFNWHYQGLDFDVALHFGTALAIVVYFWRDWVKIIGNAFNWKSKVKTTDEEVGKYPKNLLWQILVASIPAAVIGVPLDHLVEKKFHSPLLIALNLAIFGLILWYADIKSKRSQKVSEISYKQSFLVGLTQSIALIPGVSRSGITMTASRSLGLDRESAAHFSFLLATPAIVGAFLLKLKDIEHSDLNLPSLIAVAVSTIVGFLTIKYLLQYLRKGNFAMFLWYRIAIALIVMMIYFAR